MKSNQELSDLKLLRSGKVREVYEVDDKLLIVASDRISAFDVIMNEPVPDKGKILSKISILWFKKTKEIIDNHFISNDIAKYPEACKKYADYLDGRSMLVKKCSPLPIEFVVRGYIAGSAWKEYQKSNTINGIPIKAGLLECAKLDEPIFTPSTKEESGHDINIDFEKCTEILGKGLAKNLQKTAIDLYKFGAEYLDKRGIILADTKFEFGIDESGEVILIDEALTPDSSRFWLKADYKAGQSQNQFDKQVLRDYLETLDWDKTPPPPVLPEAIITKVLATYNSAYRMICS
ncbi:MAG: phosphoribosylaminoimidazolesuccinocarboxamide synthase [bacterium]